MAQIKTDEISKILREQIANYEQTVSVDEVGSVISVGDGIARIHGLEKVMYGEMLAFPQEVFGIAMNLEEEEVGAVLLGESRELKEGDTVRRTSTIMSVPVGEELIGRVLNPLGAPEDDKGPIAAKQRNPLERMAPGVLDRQPVREPLQTGIKAIDSMIPIGRGQRELIIGDRQTGKTAVILDTIINQKGSDMICIYCAIGQKRSTIAQVVKGSDRCGRDGLHDCCGVFGIRAGLPAVHCAVCGLRDWRIFSRQQTARGHVLRRPFEARAGLPRDLPFAAAPAGTGGLPRRRVLPALALARAGGKAARQARRRITDVAAGD